LTCIKSMPTFYHTGLFFAEGTIQKMPQLGQRLRVDKRNRAQFHVRAGCAVKHPRGNVETPETHVAMRITAGNQSALPAPLKTDWDLLPIESVPRVVNFPDLGLMCFVLLIYITGLEPISR
jgi:hypothetical protein